MPTDNQALAVYRALSFAVDRAITWAVVDYDDDDALGRRVRAIVAAREAIADKLLDAADERDDDAAVTA